MSTTPQSVEANQPKTLENSAILANKAQTSPLAPLRDENGRLLPGQSGNPSGRPKSKHITEAYKAIVEERGADSLAEVVWNDAHNAKRPAERLAAVQEITDRIEGKAVASVVIGHTIDPNALDRLSTMLEKLMLNSVEDDEP